MQLEIFFRNFSLRYLLSRMIKEWKEVGSGLLLVQLPLGQVHIGVYYIFKFFFSFTNLPSYKLG